MDKEEAMLTLDEYIKKANPHYGLVASFKAENKKALEDKRTEKDWEAAFSIQSRKIYKK